MTKREVRAAALSLLEVEGGRRALGRGGGHGLGLGGAGPPGPAGGRVYAVERKGEALSLICANRTRFGAWNLVPVGGTAPAALEDLPAPDGVFVGGSGGELDAILAAALGKNPRVRLCVSAIALETLSAAAAAFAARGLEAQVTQIWAARSKGGRWAEPDDGAESGVAHLRPPEGGGGMRELEHSRPADIEAESFRIIGAELAERGIVLPADQAPLVKRAIHTTADFDYARNLVFTPGAVEAGVRALRAGTPILTDTNMARSGINRGALERLGISVHCFMADPEVARRAAEAGTTRAAAAVDQGAALWPGGSMPWATPPPR